MEQMNGSKMTCFLEKRGEQSAKLIDCGCQQSEWEMLCLCRSRCRNCVAVQLGCEDEKPNMVFSSILTEV